MVFYPVEKDSWVEFKILSVLERSSESEVSIFKGQPAPSAGWRLTTRDDRPPRALGLGGMCGGIAPDQRGWRLASGYGDKDAD